MLVLTRRVGEKIIMEYKDKKIELVIARLENGQVRIGIGADKDVNIFRSELKQTLTHK